MIGFWYVSFLTERENMNEFERIIGDSMMDEDGREWLVTDDTGWDPIMGEDDEWIETDDAWLDDFQGEEDWG